MASEARGRFGAEREWEAFGPLRVPLPPPPLPPPAGGDVVFFTQSVAPPPRAEREDEDVMLRRVPADVARRFRAAAGGRALTHAQYLAGLVALHEAMRALPDGGDERVRAELERLGLGSVTV
jgi:hypothetical protein